MVYLNAYKLLYSIIKSFKKNFRRSPKRTELIKLLYLTDLEYFKAFGEKYSELEYIYYKKGPWTQQYHELLEYMNGEEIIESRQISEEGKVFFLYSLTQTKPRHEIDLEEDVDMILENNLFIYKESDLNQILEVVYKNEPMVSTRRGDLIDFTKVPLIARDKRLQYKNRRNKQLKEIDNIKNNFKEDDSTLLSDLEPCRKRANDLL